MNKIPKKKKANARMNPLDWIIITLTAIANLNWGLDYWFKLDLVRWISFGVAPIEATLKTIVAIAGIYTIIFLIKQLRKR